jgi:flagellar motor switch protein FliG
MRELAEMWPTAAPPHAAPPSPIQKAAIILTAVGPALAAPVLKDIDPDSLQRFARAVSSLGRVSPDLLDKVLVEFADALARGGDLAGGEKTARRLLEAILDEGALATALGGDASAEPSVWERLCHAGAPALADYVADQHPQAAAVILSALKPDLSASILERLDNVFARDVVLRLARVPSLDGRVLEALAETIDRDFLSALQHGHAERRPADLIADLMNNISSEAREGFLSHLEGEAPDLATDVQRSMFTFDQIASRIAGRDVGLVLREATEDVVLQALKFGEMQGSESVPYILSNIPRRLAERFAEDLAAMEAVSRKDGEAAHIELTRRILALQKRGEIAFVDREDA